jgi:hypothetical protein
MRIPETIALMPFPICLSNGQLTSYEQSPSESMIAGKKQQLEIAAIQYMSQ